MSSGLDPSWRPAEDEFTIFNERTWLAGMTLLAVAYGIVFILFVLTLKQLIRTITKSNYTQRLLLIIYSTVIFILGTLIVGCQAKMTQLSFIDYRLYPGGPAAFEQQQPVAINKVVEVSAVITNWMVDGMVIYRYMVIYKSCRRFPFWVVMTIPVLAFMASISLSVVWLIQISPADSPWHKFNSTINFTAPYLWMTTTLNISITIAICARLLFFRRRIAEALGPNHGAQYTSVVAMLVESSFLSSTFALLFLIPFALNNNPMQNAFIQLMGETQIIAPLLIIYRVAYGSAWVNETSQELHELEETQNSRVQVQVQFPGPQTMWSNHQSSRRDAKV